MTGVGAWALPCAAQGDTAATNSSADNAACLHPPFISLLPEVEALTLEVIAYAPPLNGCGGTPLSTLHRRSADQRVLNAAAQRLYTFRPEFGATPRGLSTVKACADRSRQPFEKVED
jgi:hypothetical protein